MPGADGERVEVVVRHATNGTEMKVTLPAGAKFKHVKTALAKRLESDEILTRGQLMNNNGGVYSAYKDNQRIGDVRLILTLCVDLEVPDDGPMEASLDEAEMSDSEEAPSGSAVATSTSARSTVFTRARALSLQRELLQGFQAEDFQSKLAQLESKKGSEYTQVQFAKERQSLFLTVQAAVLPNYGFEGSQAGVYKMMGAMGPFIDDPEFTKLANEINQLIGVESPQRTWASLAKSCRKVDEQPHAGPHPPRQLPRGRGLPGLLGGGLGGLSVGFGTFAAGVIAAKPSADKPSAAKPSTDKPVAAKPATDKPAAGKATDKAATSATASRPTATTAADKPIASTTAPRSAVTTATAATTAPSAVSAALPMEELDEAPLFEPWPPNKTPPFKLFVAGSWNDYRPLQMQWQEGMFACPITLGAEGQGSFQLLLNNSWDRTLYPNLEDCSALDEHTVCGPDGKGHGRNWLIGKYVEEEAKPRARFVIIAGMDSAGIVRLVSWQPVDS